MTERLASLLVAAHLLLVVSLPALAPLCGSGGKVVCAMSPGAKSCCCELFGKRPGRHSCNTQGRVCRMAPRPLESKSPLQDLVIPDGRGVMPAAVAVRSPGFEGRLEAIFSATHQPPARKTPTPPPRFPQRLSFTL